MFHIYIYIYNVQRVILFAMLKKKRQRQGGARVSREYSVVATIKFMHLNDMLGTIMVMVRLREIVCF